jgi:iron(III) transport system permease protein
MSQAEQPAMPAVDSSRRIFGRVGGSTFWICLLLAAVLVLVIVRPIATLLITSVSDPDTGAFTLENFALAYGGMPQIRALYNSLLVGGGVVFLSSVIAVPLAWAVSRTDIPGKAFIRACILASFVMPPYLGAVAWILLASPNSGFLGLALTWLTGAPAGTINVYSYWGLVFVMGSNLLLYIFIFTQSSLDMISSEMEEAAGILGAGAIKTAMRVTLPLALPGILGAMIVTFLHAIALFAVPALIAIPARLPMITIQLWQFFGYPVQTEVAAAYAMPLIAITLVLAGLQRHFLARKGYVALTGKGGERRLVRLGRKRWPAFFLAATPLAVMVLLPGSVLIKVAFSKAWARALSPDNLTLLNFQRVLFEDRDAQAAIVHSFAYGIASATMAVLLAIAVAYVVQRRLLPFASILGFLCMSPFVIPGIVLAIGFYAAYASPPFALYGTSLLLILAFTARFLPIAYAGSAASMRATNPEMEEAVRILGGSRVTAVRRIVVPILKRPLIGAWLLVLIPATQELSTAIFLSGPNNRVVSVYMLDLTSGAVFEKFAALGLVLVLLTLLFVAFGMRVVGRDFMLRRT